MIVTENLGSFDYCFHVFFYEPSDSSYNLFDNPFYVTSVIQRKTQRWFPFGNKMPKAEKEPEFPELQSPH